MGAVFWVKAGEQKFIPTIAGMLISADHSVKKVNKQAIGRVSNHCPLKSCDCHLFGKHFIPCSSPTLRLTHTESEIHCTKPTGPYRSLQIPHPVVGHRGSSGLHQAFLNNLKTPPLTPTVMYNLTAVSEDRPTDKGLEPPTLPAKRKVHKVD